MAARAQGVALAPDRYHLVPRVLCFVTWGDEVLLLRGAPDKKIWPNKYNGLGGHVERGESVQAAAYREIQEEAGLPIKDLRLRGVITVDIGEAVGIGLFVFTAEAVARAGRASAEGSLHWVNKAQLLELDLVEDLPTLLPRLLALPPTAPCFSARYGYDAADQLVIEFFETAS